MIGTSWLLLQATTQITINIAQLFIQFAKRVQLGAHDEKDKLIAGHH